MYVVAIREKGRITLPLETRRELDLRPGDPVLVFRREGGLELVPAKLVSRDRLWFLDQSIQDRTREAEEDMACARVTRLTPPKTVAEALTPLIDPEP